MPYYIAPFVGSGKPGNACRPAIAGPFIDLRPDGGATADGQGRNRCLLFLPESSRDSRLRKIAEYPDEKIGKQRFALTLARHLLPSLRPNHFGFYEVWLGHKLWQQPVIVGGVDLHRGGITPDQLNEQGYFLWRGRWIRFEPDRFRAAGWFEWRGARAKYLGLKVLWGGLRSHERRAYEIMAEMAMDALTMALMRQAMRNPDMRATIPRRKRINAAWGDNSRQ